jgi:magnesium chelatase family protein
MDRIDIHLEVPAVRYEDLQPNIPVESSASIRERIVEARRKQLERFQQEGLYANALMRPRHIKKYCRLDDAGERILRQPVEWLGLSARAYHRILKVARTVADLDHEANIAPHHVLEAIQYRSLDRTLF